MQKKTCILRWCKLQSSSMEEDEVCSRIYKIAAPYATEIKAPISYVNIILGFDAPYSEDKLHQSFAKTKWDTVLSTADLFIIRKPFRGEKDTSIKVYSISGFEDDEGNVPIIKIKRGKIA